MNGLEITVTDELLDELAARLIPILLERLQAEAAAPSRMLTVLEAADFLRAGPQRIYDLCSDGRLTRHKDGTRVLIERRELELYLDGGRNGRNL